MFELILGPFVLFAAHIKFAARHIENPVSNISLGQKFYCNLLCKGIYGVFLVTCYSDRIGIDAFAAPLSRD